MYCCTPVTYSLQLQTVQTRKACPKLKRRHPKKRLPLKSQSPKCSTLLERRCGKWPEPALLGRNAFAWPPDGSSALLLNGNSALLLNGIPCAHLWDPFWLSVGVGHTLNMWLGKCCALTEALMSPVSCRQPQPLFGVVLCHVPSVLVSLKQTSLVCCLMELRGTLFAWKGDKQSRKWKREEEGE